MACRRRDERAKDPRPTASISTRDFVLCDPVTGVENPAVQTVIDLLLVCTEPF